jgi:Protein of unknown function (DUF2845)
VIKRSVALTLPIFCVFLFNSPSFALRCNSGMLIGVGNSKYEVLKRCGEPILKEVIGVKERYNNRLRKKSIRGSSTSLIIEIWLYSYKQVAGSWDYQLTFEGSSLVDIQHISE